MSNDTTLTIRTNKQLKQAAADFFDEMWLNFSSAVNLFLRHAVQTRQLDFNIKGDSVVLNEITFEELTTDEKEQYNETKSMKKEDFKVYTLEDYAN